MLPVRRRFLLASAALFIATLFLATGLAQVDQNDPRNTSDDYFDAVNGGKCFAHHGAEGFIPFGFGMEESFAQLPMGQLVPLKVVLFENSGIDQTIQQISVVVNTTNAPGVKVITPDTVNNTERRIPATLSATGAGHKEKWSVLDGATEMYVAARTTGTPAGSQVGVGQGDLSLEVVNAAGRKLQVKGDEFSKYVRLSGDALRDAGVGEYQLTTGWSSQFDESMPVEIVVMVNYTQTQTEFIFRMPDNAQIRPNTGEKVVVEVPIVVESQEPQILDFRIQAVAYWPHNPTDGAVRDDGLYYRFMTMKVKGGDSFIQVDSAFGPQPVGPGVELYNLFARILGFVAAILIPVSMVTGGLFGKASRRWLNKVTGGAKKRVLWHSAMSWMIIAVASFHFLLALLETKFVWTKGLLWGGIGWAVLISLGFTGYYQVRMIKRWNYKVWRHTHLWSAVAVFAFTLVHFLVDGSDLQVVRDVMPDWFSRLSWP